MSHGLGIAEIARYDTFDANEDAHPRSDVTKPVEPAHKLVGLSNFEHLRTVARWLQQVNDLFVRRSRRERVIGVKRGLTEKFVTPSPRSAGEKVGMRGPA